MMKNLEKNTKSIKQEKILRHQRQSQISKCKYCEILKDPRKYFGWIFHEDELWVIGVRLGEVILCIFRQHGTLPGGHNLNEAIDILNRIKQKDEKLKFENSGHYYIWIGKKGR